SLNDAEEQLKRGAAKNKAKNDSSHAEPISLADYRRRLIMAAFRVPEDSEFDDGVDAALIELRVELDSAGKNLSLDDFCTVLSAVDMTVGGRAVAVHTEIEQRLMPQ